VFIPNTEKDFIQSLDEKGETSVGPYQVHVAKVEK
jgi:hypothetical protein